MYMPKSVKLAYINTMVVALRTNNTNDLNQTYSIALAKYGHTQASECYVQAVNTVNTKTYKFIDFSPKVNSRSDDKSIVGEIEPHHNED